MGPTGPIPPAQAQRKGFAQVSGATSRRKVNGECARSQGSWDRPPWKVTLEQDMNKKELLWGGTPRALLKRSCLLPGHTAGRTGVPSSLKPPNK